MSPGIHDCYHDPNGTEHHALQLDHLAEHLSRLDLTVVWVDTNPITRSGFGVEPWESALKCSFYVNEVSERMDNISLTCTISRAYLALPQ